MNTLHTVLKGSERHHLAGSKAISQSNPDEYIELTIKVRGKKALPDLNDRPDKQISHEELENEYGADDVDIKIVIDVLTSFGLEHISSIPAARSIHMGGTVKTMESAFNVKLMSYTHKSGDFRGRVGYVHVPATLEDIITAVFGLDSRKMISKKRHPNVRSSVSIADAVRRAWFFPAEIAGIYNFPEGDGAGQSIGILEFGGGFFPDDLKSFCNIAKVQVPNVIPISVDHTPTNSTDEAMTEVMMDIEIIAGVCPKATIPVYFGHFTERGWVNILDKAIHDKVNFPSILSISYGLSEGQNVWTQAAMTTINNNFKQAALLGITICISSGDDGSDAQVGDGYAHVSFPSTSPYVLAVGGTNLTMQNGVRNEVIWKDGDGIRNDGGGATGGGVSAFFKRPDWQSKITIKSVNPGAITGRVVPDVAAHAQTDGNTTGYFIVVQGQSSRNGGTSAAAPLWASLIARVNALLPDNKRLGYITPLLYQAGTNTADTLGTTSCNDITVGNNISAKIGGYSALAGYDAVSGWGSPNGNDLLNAVKSKV